jgi:hypothetical protein
MNAITGAAAVPAMNQTSPSLPSANQASVTQASTGRELYEIIVPARPGFNGICSSRPVVSFKYTVTAPPPGLEAVLAANKPAYDALGNADLNDPSTASLPPPLLDMSCVGFNQTSCTRAMPANRKLRPQIMCIQVRAGQAQPTVANVDVQWEYAQP